MLGRHGRLWRAVVGHHGFPALWKGAECGRERRSALHGLALHPPSVTIVNPNSPAKEGSNCSHDTLIHAHRRTPAYLEEHGARSRERLSPRMQGGEKIKKSKKKKK